MTDHHSSLSPARAISASRRAFTLIELLTVIAIIGILASILIPTVGKVRSVARSAQCCANLREMGRMCFMFANDYRGRMPMQISSNPANVLPYYYTTATVPKSYGPDQISYSLWPYYNKGNAKTGATTATSAPSRVLTLICPSHESSIAPLNAIHYALNLRTAPAGSPAAGYNVFPYVGAVSLSKMLKLNSLSNIGLSPSKVWLMQDYDTAKGDEGLGIASKPHHESKRNRLYMDGSVRSLSLTDSPVDVF